jgi:hypothetical protein
MYDSPQGPREWLLFAFAILLVVALLYVAGLAISLP